MSQFDHVFRSHVSPKIVNFLGETNIPVGYLSPIGSTAEAIELVNVIVGDVESEIRPRGERGEMLGHDVYAVRYFQLITDETLVNYSGLSNPAIKGRFTLGTEEDENYEEWVIESIPSKHNSDGLTKLKASRKLRHEIGNVKTKGLT